MEYRELVLRVVAMDGEAYRIVAECDLLRAPAEESFEPPWTLEELRQIEGKVTQAVQEELNGSEAARKAGSRATAPSARTIGLQLSRAVLTGRVEDAVERALEEAAKIEAGLRIRVVFPADLPPDRLALLTSLPWELLWLPSRRRYLGRSRRTPIVRDLESAERVQPLQRRLPLGVLIVDSGAMQRPAQHSRR